MGNCLHPVSVGKDPQPTILPLMPASPSLYNSFLPHFLSLPSVSLSSYHCLQGPYHFPPHLSFDQYHSGPWLLAL